MLFRSGVDLGRVQPRVAQQARDVDERSAVLPVRRRVHGDETAAVRQANAEIAPETRVLGRRGKAERGVVQAAAPKAMP